MRPEVFTYPAESRVAHPWPNLFIVGVARGGTTSLAECLDQHPDVFMSPVKEPHFFTRYHPDGLAVTDDETAYLKLFRQGSEAEYRGEATTAYFWDAASAEAIRDASPDARIVISLREPVSRAYSEYLLLRRSTHERRASFPAAVAEEMALTDGERDDHPQHNYVARGRYADGVARFFDTFGRERVHILFFEEFVAKPRAELRALYEFLGLDPEWAERADLTVRNQGGIARNKLAGKLLYSPPARIVGRSLIPESARAWVEGALMRPVTPDSEVAKARRLLEQVYMTDQRHLRRLLGRPVPWQAEPVVE